MHRERGEVPSMTRDTIVVAGALAQKPRHGGHAWVLLQYVLGFKRLGWDVLFLDHVADATDTSAGVAAFVRVMCDFGLAGQFALFVDGTTETIGLSRARAIERVRQSALVLNCMGYLEACEILAQARRRVFLDIDPGFPQMWRELGLHDAFSGHDPLVTICQNIAPAHSPIPTSRPP